MSQADQRGPDAELHPMRVRNHVKPREMGFIPCLPRDLAGHRDFTQKGELNG